MVLSSADLQYMDMGVVIVMEFSGIFPKKEFSCQEKCEKLDITSNLCTGV